MSYDELVTVRVEIDGGVSFATIDAPPMNVMTLPLFRDLRTFAELVADDEDVRVIVLRSADPDFFIAHFDVATLVAMPIDDPPERQDDLNAFHAMCERYRTMPKPVIAEIAGRVGGGGNELALACDMRFGAIGTTIVNQMEVPLGILPGGGGTQRLPRLVGRGRAMEIVLGGIDVDAVTAERWGLINRALEPDELTPFVTGLARRLATFPPGAVALAKQSILHAEELPLRDGLLEEAHLFQQALRLPGTNEQMREFLARGGQTREVERHVADLMIPPPTN